MHQPRTSQPHHRSITVAPPPLSIWSPHSPSCCAYIYITNTNPNPNSPRPSLWHFHKHLLCPRQFSLSNLSRLMRTQVEERFSEFFEKWVCQLEQLQQQLLKLSEETLQNEAELQALVSKVTNLHKEYYTVKWAAAREDVLAFFCPVWSSPLENAYNWVTGWKPSMLFQLIGSLRKTRLVNMSEEQLKKIEELRLKMRYEEEKVEREMERQQVAMADRRMVELARLVSRVRNGGEVVVVEVEGLVDMALKVMLSGLERVMKAADCVRLKTLKGVLDVLSPLQCVEFLAATCMVQIRLRQWGRKKCDQNALLNH